MSNPLLELAFNQLPLFSRIKPEHVEPALDEILNRNRNLLKTLLENSEFTWNNLVWPFEIMEGELDDLWSQVSHLNAVMNSPQLHEAYQGALSKLSLYHTEIKQNEKLYQAILSITKSKEYKVLNFAQKKVIENILRDFKLAGIDLSKTEREQFKNLSVKLTDLESQFEQNVLEETNAWNLLITDINKLKGLPNHVLESLQFAAENKGKEGWLLTLDFPCYHAVMTYVEDRAMRREMYKVYNTRASHNSQWNNSPIMLDIMKIRQTLATLLGFNHYAEYALTTRMLKEPEEVINFLSLLIVRSKKIALKEFEELKHFVAQEYKIDDLEPWDIYYFGEKMLQKEYAFSEEILRQYFPEDSVLNGLFTITNRLYGIKINEIKDFDTWHESVRLFEVYDESNNLRGKFYIDLYTRPNKQGGAWVARARVRMKRPDGQLQIPVIYLTANFSRSVGGIPSLLTHDEVTTLFHEFGHCLHHILTLMDYPSISTGNGVMWDAIELPSQLMENWCWEKEAIQLFSRHFETNAPLPEDLFLKLIHARNFQAGLKLIRQLEFALFDFELHRKNSEENAIYIQEILNTVRTKTAVIPVPSFNQFQNSFTHIFSGGYAAGYYSYLWSEVLSADIYEVFKEKKQIFNKGIAKQFLLTILEPGGSKDFMDLFVEFRGRTPKIDALFKQYNLE